MQTIKIFLGSSITELHDERLLLGDYLLNSVRPIFKRDGVDIEVVKCEDIRTGYRGKSSQEEINDLLRGCNISVFMFKTKAGPTTVREYNVAQKLVGTKKHEIYVYCFGVTDEEKEERLKDFKQQMREIELYWKTCKDINDLEKQFVIGLLDYERQLLGKMKPSIIDEESTNEKDADVRFNEYMLDEKKQAQRRKKIHKDIEDLLQQTKTVMANEDETIAARIFKVIELYKKADQWAAATAYDKEKYSHLLFDYAGFLYDYGLYKDAEAIYLRQIAIAEELYGKEHENTATSYNNIGGVYDAQGDYDKALEYYLKALAIMEKVLGTEHPSTATSYNNIGAVYNAHGDYDKALEYYQKALATKETVLGTEHPSTATSYSNIGALYYAQGSYAKALEYDVKALAIMEKVLGTEHPYTAQSYSNIGLVYKDQGDYGEALENLNRAYQIYAKTLGPNHPSTNNVLEWITITTSISRGHKKKLPIGIQSFESLRKDKCAYVDKTKLVFDLINDAKYVFLSRPRRFGKSLFMSTLKAYFEGKKKLFDGLAISKLEKEWESFPILYLDLNVGMYDSTNGLLETLHSNLNEWEEEFGINSNSTDVALRFMSIIKKVAKKENRNVVILVDEYDKPLLQAIDNESLQQDFRNILKAFFSNLKTCDGFIRFAMLTGVSKFSKISLFSDLNNLNDISLNEHYFNICGLTANEINQTFSVHLDDFVKQEKTDKTTLMDKMRQMYGGYHFSENTSIDIYNPFSVLNAFLEKRFRDYWFSTGTPSFLLKLLQNGDYYDLQTFSEGNIKANNLAAKECINEDPIALFYQTGYLTIKEYNKEAGNYSLGFPNREVEQGFLTYLLPRFTGQTETRSTTFLDNILTDLRNGQIEDFLKRMQSFFANTPYELIRDLENHYQNVMFTVCRLTGYKTEAEYHTSLGRIDMVVKTEQYIYVFEFKFNKTAKEAMEQIDTKEYLLPFRSDGRKLCKIGVNFSGKTNNIDDYDFCWE